MLSSGFLFNHPKITDMKKLFFSCLCGSLLIMFTSGNAISQDVAYNYFKAPTSSGNSSTVRISDKLNKAFKKLFSGAYNFSWQQLHDKYGVRFFQDGLENRAVFAKNGELVYQLTYASEMQLPFDVRKLVKSNYYDYKIALVNIVNQDDRIVYFINLENEKELISVKVDDMVMEERDRINRIN
jgi:hypothetical protein